MQGRKVGALDTEASGDREGLARHIIGVIGGKKNAGATDIRRCAPTLDRQHGLHGSFPSLIEIAFFLSDLELSCVDDADQDRIGPYLVDAFLLGDALDQCLVSRFRCNGKAVEMRPPVVSRRSKM